MLAALIGFLKGLLVVLICAALGSLTFVLTVLTLHFVGLATAALIGGLIGFLYGLEAGILQIYDVYSPISWLVLLVDLTWSLPNTAFGLVLGNLLYVFWGSLSPDQSKGQGWIVYSNSGNLAQTLGTINLGGAGQHERMHLLQARIFGPLYLPLFAASYVVTFLTQILWTITLGGLLYLLKVRTKPNFSPPEESVVHGFWGWIYYATPFELWAYASGNP